ncbi:MAG: hypothetical protein L3K23_02335 [Thermoplasmata archaeon]|nr:hypothetical protein [Thermoplasmata archaeon]
MVSEKRAAASADLDPPLRPQGSGGPPGESPRSEGPGVARRHRRSRLPLVLGAALAVLLGGALWVGVFGLPPAPSLANGKPPPTPPPAPNDSIVILPAGTIWDVGAGHFESVWFAVPSVSEVYGQLRASSVVKLWIVPTGAYPGWSGSNGTYGADPPAGSSGELAANWSTGPTTTAALSAIQLGPGSYDFIVENTDSAQSSSVSVFSDLADAPYGAD